MTQTDKNSMAEAVALSALEWLAGTDDLLQVFLGTTGIAAGDLRQLLEDPEVLAAILDFVLMDDAWVLGWAEAAGGPPEALSQARALLPGGEIPNWT